METLNLLHLVVEKGRQALNVMLFDPDGLVEFLLFHRVCVETACPFHGMPPLARVTTPVVKQKSVFVFFWVPKDGLKR